MPDETTPPSPQAGDGGTNPQPQAGDPQPTPQAGSGKTPEDYERMLAELRKENAGHRTKLKKFEDDEAARTQAQMTEQEKLQAERDALQARNEDLAAALKKQNVNQEVARYASKLNFVITSPGLIAQMLTWKEIEWDEESGVPTNIEKLLEKLAKAEPDLVKQQSGTPGQPGTPALPAMNPGRSSITQPGGNVPGKIPRLEDIQWKR